MDFLKHIFGGDSKNDYSERIPDLLTPDQFGVHPTFHHGFLTQPSCLAYDCVQNVLAIGSHQGNISIIGKPALEKHLSQPGQTPVLQLLFVMNRGQLISRCTDNALYLWNIRCKIPYVEHKLVFQKDSPSLMSLSYQSDWLYVGMEGGNVHLVQVSNFQVSGYTIYWDKVTAHEAGHRNRPGDVIGIQEHPIDASKVLLAFSGGLCVLWNVKTKAADKRYKLSNKSITILLSIDWNGNGKQFAAAYSDGTIGIYNMKNEGKPERIIDPHKSVSSNAPILKLQWINNDGPEPMFVFSGGFPGDSSSVGVKSLTFYNSKTTNLLNFDSSIIDYICLPSSPFVIDTQRLFAAVVLTDDQLIVHDLQSHGFPVFNIPYAFDINSSPVTSIGYYGNCPDDFVAELQSVLTKLPQQLKSTKRWPLSGGKWGQELPDPWTDLIITGHADGTVKLWYCRSVIMQPLLTIDISHYLKPVTNTSTIATPPGQQLATPTQQVTIPPRRISSVPDMTINQTTPHMQSTDQLLLTTPTNGETTPTVELTTPHNIEPTTDQILATPTKEPRRRVTTLPTGQVLAKSTNNKLVSVTKDTPPNKRKNMKMFSFKNMKKSSKIDEDIIEEIVDKETPLTPPTLINEEEEEPIVKHKRPTDLNGPPTVTKRTIPTVASRTPPVATSRTPPTSTSRNTTSPPIAATSRTDGEYMILSLTNTTTTTNGNHGNGNHGNGNCIHFVRMEPQSQTLCISTRGGHILCMDFALKPADRQIQSLQINFAIDSVIKPDEDDDEGVANLINHTSPNYQFDYVINNDTDKLLPGFHVFQHCFGYYGNHKNISGIHVTDVRYNTHRNILVIGSDYGLSIIDTKQNICLKTLTHLESILYISDPSNYSRQCRKIIEDTFQTPSSPQQTVHERQYTEQLMSPLLTSIDDLSYNSTSKTILDNESHTSDHLITKVEIVQMFVNKSGECSLTLWVGSKCGKVCVYIINTTKQSKQRKIELLPTGIVIDMKSFLVEMMFLSEWGERLINPYMDDSNSSKSSPAIVAVNRRRSISSKSAVETEKSVNYAIITVRDKIKSIGFPSNQCIAETKPILSNGFIVGSDMISCDNLPCIISWTNNGLILIHTLPGLKPMLNINHTPLLDSRTLYSFQVACDGQAIYLTTPTQLQCISLIKANQPNYPECLPDVFVNGRTDPQPISRGILHGLFKQGSTIDRNDLFGIETAGKAWRSVAKRDDSLVKPVTRPAGGATNAFEKAREKLDQRGKDLSELEEKTEQLQNDAVDFVNVAHLLAEKHRKKRLF